MFPEFLWAFFAALILSLGGSFFVKKFAFGRGVVSLPDKQRRFQQSGAPLRGGAAVVLAIILSIFLNGNLVLTSQISAVVFGLVLFLAAGLLDDKKALPWFVLFGVQLFAGIILVTLGAARLSYVNGFYGGAWRLDQLVINAPFGVCGTGSNCSVPLLGALLVIFWVVLISNAFNWLDGSDGLAGFSAIIVFIALAAISLTVSVNQPAIAILSVIALGAILGFMAFNLPKAGLLLGNSGSFALGFYMAALSVIAGAKLATLAIVFMLPSSDALSVLILRLRAKAPLTKGDKRHLHHFLFRRGWSPRKIMFFNAAVSAVLVLPAVFLPRPYKLIFLAIGFLTLTILILWFKLKSDSEFKA